MLISEMIAELQKVLVDQGDLPVALRAADDCGINYESCRAAYLAVESIDFEDVVHTKDPKLGHFVRSVIARSGPHLVIDAV